MCLWPWDVCFRAFVALKRVLCGFGCIIVCAPQIVVSLGLVLVHFLLVWGSLGLVRCEFEVWVPFRFPGFPVNRFSHFRYALS